MSHRLKAVCAVAVMSALLAVSAWLTVPTSPPFTMQTFVLYLCAWCFGRKKATAAVIVYWILGAVGVPVFSGFCGGLGVLLGPTGGYILGFAAISLLGGEQQAGGRRIALTACGTLVCYAVGTLWYAGVYSDFQTGGIVTALMTCVLPFILPDLAKFLLALGVCRRVEKPLSAMFS